MNAFRIGWELLDNWDDYQCFGLGRSAIVQFWRGCPHQCTYCGQRDFWVKWRHRDPLKVVDEIEWLYRTHNVRFISLADENPASNKTTWLSFLKELASREEQRHLSTWKVFLAVKWLELCVHARPGRLWAIITTRDRFRRRQLLWSFFHTGLVQKPCKINCLGFNTCDMEPDGLIMAESELCSAYTQPNLNLPLFWRYWFKIRFSMLNCIVTTNNVRNLYTINSLLL